MRTPAEAFREVVMLIFDRFSSMKRARLCAAYIQSYCHRQTWVCATDEETNETDPIPYCVTPPTVLVARNDDYDGEEEIIECVERVFRGRFAGT
jgi:hypothetical protein